MYAVEKRRCVHVDVTTVDFYEPRRHADFPKGGPLGDDSNVRVVKDFSFIHWRVIETCKQTQLLAQLESQRLDDRDWLACMI
mmetsp:Transcript_13809/g.27490  ORF Transcript_13809/g.27490 Transcript_13809/m.27490 type:complete len:82 (-) Transcript_13809:21-266(-)